MKEQTAIDRHIDWLKRTYFSDPAKRITLADGEELLQPGQYNDRLFLILEGMLTGYIEHSTGDRFETFRSGKDNLVGAYSFFSNTHQSYSTVRAEGLTQVAYIAQRDITGEDGFAYGEFAARILPVIVDEIYIRQLLAQRMSIENQEAMKRLAQAEKLATLGQMAAGLAHELNNAIGVILRKAEWLSDRVSEYIQEKDTRNLYPFFQRGLQLGQSLGSRELRSRRRELENRFGFKPHIAKTLAKIGMPDTELQKYQRSIRQVADRANYYYETGLALHDMLIAARHANKVLGSVRELGASTRGAPIPTDINQTLLEAVSLLDEKLRRIKLKLHLGDALPEVTANPSDWVQVWVNIIKNAVEAMEETPSSQATLHIRSGSDDHTLTVAITDNGPGIPPGLRDEIFQPNFTTKKEGLSFGLGLGLSIVQKIVETYEGNIEVESHPGETTFRVRIPVR